MEFCEKCGRIIIFKNDKAICSSCGWRPKKKIRIKASEKLNKHGTIAVINEKTENVYPIVEIECPVCKNKHAYFWTSQTRSSDESETKFYRCVKCNHSWRKYR